MKHPPGIHHSIPPGDYHRIQAASASQLRTIRSGTPAHLRIELDNPEPPTWEMIFGTLIHSVVLEPDAPLPGIARVPDKYVIPEGTACKKGDPQPGDLVDWNSRTKYCRQWVADQEAAGLIVMAQSEIDELHQAAERVCRNPEARDLIQQSAKEVSIFWKTADGIDTKARLDMVYPSRIIPDLKTSVSARESDFRRQAIASGYHLQAAFYIDMWNAAGDTTKDGFKFIVYEKKTGLVRVFDCSEAFIAKGREEYLVALQQYTDAVRTGVWPGYPDEPAVLDWVEGRVR